MNLGEAKETRQPFLWAALGIGFFVTAAALWSLSRSTLLVVAFCGTLALLISAIMLISRLGAGRRRDDLAPPDWSVTVTAIEQPDLAIAITDRANRMTCANSRYTDWFGFEAAPPDLPLERASLEDMIRVAREAWRDGTSQSNILKGVRGTTGWRASAERAGRGEDHLIWRISQEKEQNRTVEVAEWITGDLGQLLSRAGIETALVGSDGIIIACGAGFAERVAGDSGATLAGQEFVSHLRSDDQDRIFFAREGRKGPPQKLIQVPVEDPHSSRVAKADERPSLMLLVDSAAGIGGADAAGSNATPQLESLLGALPLGLAMTDRDGRFLFGNEAFQRAVGREGQGVPQYPSDLVVREDKSALSDAVRRFGKGPASSGDMAVRLRDNPEEPVSLSLAGVRGLGDAAVLLSLVDSTEETRLKRQIVQASKMQAVGQLAGGVAHDFNNVLTAIIGYCDLMLLRHTPGDSDYDDIQQIRANSNRAASLTRQLLAFSRQQTLRPEVLQLPDVVSEMSHLLKRLLGERIELQVRHDRDLGPVRADPQQLEQVIMNLAVNARDAIQANGDGSGRLTMATRRVSAQDIRSLGSDIVPVADYTVLIAQDTGGGIAPELISKIFEPFFTTKEQGKGTGLGLSTVYGIVKQSGGFIFADNIERPNGHPIGAQFTVYLPVHQGETPRAKKEQATKVERNWSGGGRVLLVEDEDMVRAVAERGLSRAGYTVIAAADGEEGLTAFANQGEFDLIISDVVMPVMDGPAMVKAIRKKAARLPVLFMSGYAEEQLRREIDVPNMHFIAKPFSVQQLGDKVGAVMEQSKSSES